MSAPLTLGRTGRAMAVLCAAQILRLSLVDPWMHDKSDGFPLLYIRSHAARLPGRCRGALSGGCGTAPGTGSKQESC